MTMAGNARAKAKGGVKNSADKNTFNPPTRGGSPPDTDAKGPEEQDPKRRIGQFGGAGEPPLMKK
jgi:hypothetical protein